MTDQPIPTRRPSQQDSLLRDKLTEEIASQPQRMDSLAQQLITIELAIPGLYATVLKLVQGDKGVLSAQPSLYVAFGLWMLALALTLGALFPRSYDVDTRTLRRRRATRPGEALSIEEYFSLAARHKRWLLVASCIAFFSGLLAAIGNSL